MKTYPDFMLDIETTGTDPGKTGILQIGVVAFNVDTGDVDPQFFKKSLVLPPSRYWDEDTRAWWSQRSALLADIRSRAEPVVDVLRALQGWVVERTQHANAVRLWGKPISFDGAFVESYFREFGVETPFSFRDVVDMRTFIRAKLGTWEIGDWEKARPFIGSKHDALMDALHQTKQVLQSVGKA